MRRITAIQAATWRSLFGHCCTEGNTGTRNWTCHGIIVSKVFREHSSQSSSLQKVLELNSIKAILGERCSYYTLLLYITSYYTLLGSCTQILDTWVHISTSSLKLTPSGITISCSFVRVQLAYIFIIMMRYSVQRISSIYARNLQCCKQLNLTPLLCSHISDRESIMKLGYKMRPCSDHERTPMAGIDIRIVKLIVDYCEKFRNSVDTQISTELKLSAFIGCLQGVSLDLEVLKNSYLNM